MAEEAVWTENFADRKVTYPMQVDGRFILVRNGPAGVNVETGEELFPPRRLSTCSLL